MEKLEMVLATRNAGKAAELQALLRARYGTEITLLTLSEIGFEGDIEETGQTFAENALLKARAAGGSRTWRGPRNLFGTLCRRTRQR